MSRPKQNDHKVSIERKERARERNRGLIESYKSMHPLVGSLTTSTSEYGKRITEYRKKAEMTQMALAEQVGISPVALGKIEAGGYVNISKELFYHFLCALDCRPENLLNEEDFEDTTKYAKENELGHTIQYNPKKMSEYTYPVVFDADILAKTYLELHRIKAEHPLLLESIHNLLVTKDTQLYSKAQKMLEILVAK